MCFVGYQGITKPLMEDNTMKQKSDLLARLLQRHKDKYAKKSAYLSFDIDCDSVIIRKDIGLN